MLVTDHQFTFHGKTVSLCFVFQDITFFRLTLFNRLHSVLKLFKRRFKKMDTNTFILIINYALMFSFLHVNLCR